MALHKQAALTVAAIHWSNTVSMRVGTVNSDSRNAGFFTV